MTELPVIDQPTRRSGALLQLLARRMQGASELALKESALRPRHLIAMTVLRDAGESSQAELAGMLQMDRTNLVGLLNELENEGLIERRRSPEDRRRHSVVLTETGGERLAHAEFTLAAAEDLVLGGLSPKQRETLYDLLHKAITAGC